MKSYRVNLKHLFAIFLGLVVSSYSLAEAKVTNLQKNHDAFQSNVLNEKRSFVVQLPESYYEQTDKRYPVIYRLDGAGNIPLLTSVLKQLNDAQSAPEVIIVAIENTDRMRDLFPTANQDPRGPLGVGGGADKFLEFFKQELIPFIDENYRTHDYKVIAGGSAAGVFTLYAMQSPGLFDAHITYSPAVWWNDGASIKTTKTFLKSHQNLESYLFMSIGNEAAFMRGYYDDLQEFVVSNRPKNMTLQTEVYDNVPHGLVSGASIFSAYHNLFLSKYMALTSFDGNVNSISNYYSKLSKQWGENISPPEGVVRGFGYHFTTLKDHETALKLYRFNTKTHPNSADAHNGLAYGLESAGQFEQSLKHVNLAISMSKETDDGFDIFIARRDRLKKLIADSVD